MHAFLIGVTAHLLLCKEGFMLQSNPTEDVVLVDNDIDNLLWPKPHGYPAICLYVPSGCSAWSNKQHIVQDCLDACRSEF